MTSKHTTGPALARLRVGFWLAVALVAAVWGALLVRSHWPRQRPAAQAPGAALMGGMALTNAPAPDFTLTNQFGQVRSLRQYRGKVVLLAFVDSQCTTICPLTTQSMLDAQKLLGSAAGQVALVGVNANPEATTVADVRAYSRAHGMLNAWDFVTGSPSSLRAVWGAYNVATEILAGAIDHTPALYVLDPQGNERYLYLTPLQYGALSQEAAILAGDAARLLPGHPAIVPAPPTGASLSGQPMVLPLLVGGGPPLRLAMGTPRLLVFWTTWAPDAATRLQDLNAYAKIAQRDNLPALAAVDVGDTEATPRAARDLLHTTGPLAYPVGLDASGGVADNYGVQDMPWLVLTDGHGRVRWSHDGWLGGDALAAAVHRALAATPTPTGA